MPDRPNILGGDTPFVAASDAPFLYPPDLNHRPLKIAVDGHDSTRFVSLAMLAMMQNFQRADMPDPARLREFMEGAIVGANTDLRALGIHPLVSFAEVDDCERELVARRVINADGSRPREAGQ